MHRAGCLPRDKSFFIKNAERNLRKMCSDFVPSVVTNSRIHPETNRSQRQILSVKGVTRMYPKSKPLSIPHAGLLVCFAFAVISVTIAVSGNPFDAQMDLPGSYFNLFVLAAGLIASSAVFERDAGTIDQQTEHISNGGPVRKAANLCFFLIIATGATAAQTPNAPGFDREEIRFTSGSFQLAGELLTPRCEGPYPVVVYVWGAGPTNRKRLIEHSQLLRIFLEKGFAVLVYDKPGSGDSKGEFDNRSLFKERAAILVDAIGLLQRRKGVNPEAIGLYGSSQASYVMAVALGRTRGIAFVICSSCPMENSIEQGGYLVSNYVRCEGGTQEEGRRAGDAYVRRARARTYAEYRTAAAYLDGIPAIRDGLGWAGIVAEADFTPTDTASESFFDPSTAIGSLKIPILALFAERDRQIDPNQGAEAFRRLLSRGASELSSVAVIPGADHNMIVSPRGCVQDQKDDYKSIGGRTVSPAFLDMVSKWIERLRALMMRP
jgi:pimeloyl-ACP methyl ester carboxylesterase